MDQVRTKIGQGGRVVIPAPHRRALGLRIGDEIIVRVEDDELRIQSLDHAIRRAQSVVRRYVKRGELLSEELIAERRSEAAGD